MTGGKFEYIKNAIFNAQQAPEKLATIIAGMITDEVTSVSVRPSANVVEKGKSITVKGVALSQYADEMSNTVTLSIPTTTGVTLSNGTLSVTSSATATEVVVTGTCSGKTNTATIKIK